MSHNYEFENNLHREVVERIRSGEIDINNQELFFSALIKGLMVNLDKDISIRGIPVPHLIVHTGSEALYLEQKGQDYSLEPLQISNEKYIYNIVPRCVVNPGGINLAPEQMSNPYITGQLQYAAEDSLISLTGEVRRMPVKLSVDLKYFTDSYRDMLELVQQTLSKLAYIRTYHITYMGQAITCSYKIPESFAGEHVTELDGKSQDEKCHTLSLSIEVETTYPIYVPETIMATDAVVKSHKYSVTISHNIN